MPLPAELSDVAARLSAARSTWRCPSDCMEMGDPTSVSPRRHPALTRPRRLLGLRSQGLSLAGNQRPLRSAQRMHPCLPVASRIRPEGSSSSAAVQLCALVTSTYRPRTEDPEGAGGM